MTSGMSMTTATSDAGRVGASMTRLLEQFRNGKPAALVRVQFTHADASLPGNLKIPMGMTDEAGVFHLSTSGDRDGAVPGEYTVTFEWMSANELAAHDKFGGKFAKSSLFKATVAATDNRLPPFDITLPESAIVTKPPRGPQ